MKTNHLKITFHILYFVTLIYVFLFGYGYNLDLLFSRDIFSRDLFEIFSITVSTYLFYYIVFVRKILISFKIIWLSVCILLFTAIAINKNHFAIESGLIHVFSDLLRYIGFGSILFFILWILDNAKFLKNERFITTKKALKEAENKLLRQQFNPHFLFNAFNSLYSLSLQSHPKTSETILKLSGMMRYVTDDSTVSNVKLSRELRFIEDYISIEKLRFNDSERINITISGNIESVTIEPLLLITLVENAFKHGFYTNDPNSFITIEVNAVGTTLLFKVENYVQDKQHFNTTKRIGKGLENLKKRLQLSYPNKHKLSLQCERNVFLAELKLNLP